MTTISTALKNHLAQHGTTVTTLFRLVRRDGTEFYFTNLDDDVTYDGNVYKSALGYSRTDIDQKQGLAVDNLNIIGFLDDTSIKESELNAGLFDDAVFYLSLVNWDDISQGIMKVVKGVFSEVTYSSDSERFDAELRGIEVYFDIVPIELFQPGCRADLGDSRCKIPIAPDEVQRSTAYALGDFVRVDFDSSGRDETYHDLIFECTTAGTTAGSAPTFDETAGNTTTDGTVVWTAVEAWTRAIEVATVTNNRVFTVTFPNGADPREVDDWFKRGAVRWDTGDNAGGQAMEVKGFDATLDKITLFLEMPNTVQVGDKGSVYAGCNLLESTCKDKFDNKINFRGEYTLTGLDGLLGNNNA